MWRRRICLQFLTSPVLFSAAKHNVLSVTANASRTSTSVHSIKKKPTQTSVVWVVEGKRWDAYPERFYISRPDYLAPFGAMLVFSVSGLKTLVRAPSKIRIFPPPCACPCLGLFSKSWLCLVHLLLFVNSFYLRTQQHLKTFRCSRACKRRLGTLYCTKLLKDQIRFSMLLSTGDQM